MNKVCIILNILSALGAIIAFFDLMKRAKRRIMMRKRTKLGKLERVLEAVKNQQVEVERLQRLCLKNRPRRIRKILKRITALVGKLNQCGSKYLENDSLLFQKILSITKLMNDPPSSDANKILIILRDVERKMDKLIELIEKEINRLKR